MLHNTGTLLPFLTYAMKTKITKSLSHNLSQPKYYHYSDLAG